MSVVVFFFLSFRGNKAIHVENCVWNRHDCKLMMIVIRVRTRPYRRALCAPNRWIVPSFISRGAPHQAAREASISEGRKLRERILPTTRNDLLLLGSFTCPKFGAWDRLFNFPSEGRHAEDFYIRKIQRLRPGLNPRTREWNRHTLAVPLGQVLKVFASLSSFKSHRSWRVFASIS
jgi:hypothetical protein